MGHCSGLPFLGLVKKSYIPRPLFFHDVDGSLSKHQVCVCRVEESRGLPNTFHNSSCGEKTQIEGDTFTLPFERDLSSAHVWLTINFPSL